MSRLDAVEVLKGRLRTDPRGRLHVTLGASQLPPGVTFGEVYVVFTDGVGERRGDHRHVHADEWFSVIEGVADLELLDPETHERRVLRLHADAAETVRVPAGVAHCLVNIGPGRMVTVAWSSEEHDPSDTIPHSTVR